MGRYHNIVLCGGMSFVVYPPPNERMDVTGESHRQSIYRGFSVSPTSSPQVALDSNQTATFTRFGLWQAKGGATPLVQGPQGSPLNTPAERSANVTSSPQPDVTPGEQAGGLASEPRPRHLPPVRNRVSHEIINNIRELR